MKLKSVMKSLLLRLGYEVSRSVGNGAIFRHFKVDVIFDVGANDGQFGRALRARGYGGKVVSFEPLSSSHERLIRASKSDPSWIVHPRAAVGSRSGRTIINISNNGQSSSLKKMLDRHVKYAPDSAIVGSEEVEVVALDDCFFMYAAPADLTYLKIDTQGFELEVLQGASRVLSHVDILEMEMSVVELYEDASNYLELLEYAQQHGFILWGLSPAFVDDKSKRLLQFDALFVRGELAQELDKI